MYNYYLFVWCYIYLFFIIVVAEIINIYLFIYSFIFNFSIFVLFWKVATKMKEEKILRVFFIVCNNFKSGKTLLVKVAVSQDFLAIF